MPSHTFLPIDVQKLYQKVEKSDYLYTTNIEEYFADQIAISLDKSECRDVKGVIIDKGLMGDGWGRAIRLAGHIALTPYSKCQLNRVPIILTDSSPLDIRDSSLTETPISHPFQAGGFHFMTYEELFTLNTDPISGKEVFLFEQGQLQKVTHENLHINGPGDSSHQSTNEWGAMRLAYSFGLKGQIEFNYPRHLYFKYLALSLEDGSIPQDTALFRLFHKVLLIDDQAGQGWLEVMGRIFGCEVVPLIPKKNNLSWQGEKFDQYDLVLLDLYLEGKSDKALSLIILKFVKERHPHIPVVIFTASEKAWNLYEVKDRGADGMYIKESPVHLKDSQYRLDNYNNFKHTIESVHAKYKFLRPYWEVIRSIRANNNFLSIENGRKKMKDRLTERLKMFYGLLKKGYEQSSYDKMTFFYSDYELAFMTLWSALNETQEYKFKKTRPGTIEQWQLRSDRSIYLFHNSASRHASRFKTDLLSIPIHIGRSSPDQKLRTFKQMISLQITFIIERMNPRNKFAMMTKLKTLNMTRNKLYLTHGDDSMNSNFFGSTEEGKRKASATITSSGDIKDLFNIVSYLLTGDEKLRV